MNGWIGTTLRVDLGSGTIKREPTNMTVAHEYIGARGMGVKIISDEVDPKADALGPDNKLVFAPGPFTGTFAPSGGRYNVITKSPLNGTIAASNSGGVFGPELKFAGYDALIVEGQSATPVYLWIKNDKVEIRDASAVWGMTVDCGIQRSACAFAGSAPSSAGSASLPTVTSTRASMSASASSASRYRRG